MGFAELYHRYNVELADQRTNGWWFVSSPIPMLITLSSYLYFVLICGPRYMEKSKAYNLKTFISYYNVFQIIYNTWLVYKVVNGGWLTHLTVGCEPIDYSLDPMALQLAEATWWTMILKLIDLSETVVFVLRKKNQQISLLHVYHHITTLMLTWVSAKYFAGGMCTFSILVNSIVHVIMYSYYFLSARGPKTRALVSLIKPYITIIQMVQFCMLLAHSIQGTLPSCEVPTLGAWIYIANLLINFYLFYDFYKKNYLSKKEL